MLNKIIKTAPDPRRRRVRSEAREILSARPALHRGKKGNVLLSEPREPIESGYRKELLERIQTGFAFLVIC